MNFSFKQRVIAFFGGGGEYSSLWFQARFHFSVFLSCANTFLIPMSLISLLGGFCCLIFLFLSPLLVIIFPVIFTGKQITVSSGKKLLKTTFIILGLTVLGMFIFSERYTTSLIHKGYTVCQGIPSGWMPGKAKKYVIEPSLCTQH